MGNYTKSFNFRNGVQVDDSNFIVNANGLVGIGTSIPEKRLDVRGNTKIIGDTRLVGLTSITDLNVVGVVTIGSAVKIDSGSGIITATKFVGDASGLQNIVAIATDGFIANTGTLSTTAKIGIGTLSPETQLDVLGDSIFAGITSVTGETLFTTQFNVSGVSTFLDDVIVGTSATVGIGTTVFFGDDIKAKFGDDEDLTIFHEGPHSNIVNTNTSGFLSVNTDNFRVQDGNGNDNIIRGFKDGAVELYHGNTKRFETSSGGVIVTGIASFTVGAKIYEATHNDETNLGAGLGFLRPSDGVFPISGVFAHSNNGLGVAARDHITFLTGGSSLVNDTEENVRITSDGKVGIGTDTPAAKLDIVGGDLNVNGKFQTISTGASVYNQLNVASFNGGASGLSSHFGSLRYGNEDQSTSPFSTRRSLDFINNDSGNINFYLNANNLEAPNDGSDFHWHKGFNNSQLMTLTNSGTLGIGLTTPDSTRKLHVDGKIKVTGISTFGSDLFVGNNLNVKNTLTASTLDADVTGNLTGNVNAASGVSTFSAIKTTDKTATNFAGVGIGTTVSNPNYIETINSTLDKTSQFIVNTEGKVAIGTDNIRDGVGLNAHKEKATFGAVGVGTTSPLAAVDFRDAGKDGTDAFINRMYMLPPSLDDNERDGLQGLTAGALIYNRQHNRLELYDGSNWNKLTMTLVSG